LRVQAYAVHQPEVDDVDAEFGVNDVPHRFEQIRDFRARIGIQAVRSYIGVEISVRHVCSPSTELSARTVASFHAIQPSSAHLILAGYLATPAKTTASPRISSSGSVSRSCISSRKAALMSMASATGLPI